MEKKKREDKGAKNNKDSKEKCTWKRTNNQRTLIRSWKRKASNFLFTSVSLYTNSNDKR